MSAAPGGGMVASFDALAHALDQACRPGELWVGVWQGEQADYVRFNHGRLLQAGRVDRVLLRLRGLMGDRQAEVHLTLPGLPCTVAQMATWLVPALVQVRALWVLSAPDPWLEVCRVPHCHTDAPASAPCPPDAWVPVVVSAAAGSDLVGFGAAGPITRRVCGTLGTRLWFERSRLVFEAVLAPPGSEDGAARSRGAVKVSWTGDYWDPAALAAAIEQGRADAAIMAGPARVLSPGAYRAYLAPHALGELLSTMAWGGFSARAHQCGQSPLASLQRGERQLSPRIALAEDLSTGWAPRF